MKPPHFISFYILTNFLVSGLDGPLLNKHYQCLDTNSHKREPGPESELFSQCTPWKSLSCCTYNTTEKAKGLSLYKFNFDHCSETKKLSEECKKHFVQDLCFYECSPNIGPWIVKVFSKHRRERFFGIPLCRSECFSWFQACENDFTCTDNWARNFIWNEDGNKCSDSSKCQTFKQIFENAENFCEKVWDGSWKVVNDSEPCMKIWFDSSKGNPNDQVALMKLEELSKMSESSDNGSPLIHTSGSVLISALIIFWTL